MLSPVRCLICLILRGFISSIYDIDVRPSTGIIAGMSKQNTVEIAAVEFLKFKQKELDRGNIKPATIRGYRENARRFVALFGARTQLANIGPKQFQHAMQRITNARPTSQNTYMLGIEVIFNFCVRHGLLERRPDFGAYWSKFSKHNLDDVRIQRLFSREEILTMLAGADHHLKAMILLGISCAMNNGDVAELRKSVIDYGNACMNYRRVKTKVPRPLLPLWPETIEALKAAVAMRPKAADAEWDDYVFLTEKGKPYAHSPNGYLSKKFGKFLKGINVHRAQCGFNTLRHTFKTIATNNRNNQVAVDAIMGHRPPGVGGNYLEFVDEEWIGDVSRSVHDWLFDCQPQQDTTPFRLRVVG